MIDHQLWSSARGDMHAGNDTAPGEPGGTGAPSALLRRDRPGGDAHARPDGVAGGGWANGAADRTAGAAERGYGAARVAPLPARRAGRAATPAAAGAAGV